MVVRPNSASKGIKKYLQTAVKAGRKESRNQLDERVVLRGDLYRLDTIINTTEGNGDKYAHVTLGFAERDMSSDRMREIGERYLELLMCAYEPEEFYPYMEAHQPRTKMAVNKKTGEKYERLPHIHLVIPLVNLKTGKRLYPFGKTTINEKWLDSIQELINIEFNLASPKDQTRAGSSLAAVLSRDKADEFEPQMATKPKKQQPKRTPEEYRELVREWITVRSREVKYNVNSAYRKLWAEYSVASPERRLTILDDLEARHQAMIHPDNEKNLGAQHQDVAYPVLSERVGVEEGNAETAENIHSSPVLPVSGPTEVNQETGRLSDSLIDQLLRDKREQMVVEGAKADRDIQEIKRSIDAARMLQELSLAYHLNPADYVIKKGSDGGDRIRHKTGKHWLNTGDFLTQEMHLPWQAAQVCLVKLYQAQLSDRLIPLTPPAPDPALYARFLAKHRAEQQRLQSKRNEHYAESRRITAEYRMKKKEIYDAHRTRAARRAQLSLLNMEKVRLDIARRLARQHLLEEQREMADMAAAFTKYLMRQAQMRDEKALAELRRLRVRPHSSGEREFTAGDGHRDRAEITQWSVSGLSYQVNKYGDVSYFKADVEVLRDEGWKVRVFDVSDDSLELGLCLAQQKFGRQITIVGDEHFARASIRKAFELGLSIEFTDPAHQAVLKNLRNQTPQEGITNLSASAVKYLAKVQKPASAFPDPWQPPKPTPSKRFRS